MYYIYVHCFRVQPGNLNRRSGRSDLGSLPDLSAVRQLTPVLTPIPREQALLLCHQKQEELQLMLEREQQRRRRTFVLRLGDFKVRQKPTPVTVSNNSNNSGSVSTNFRYLWHQQQRHDNINSV